MRNLRNVLVVVGGVLGCGLVGAVAAVGCSSSSETALPEAGADVTTTTDAHPDVQVNEAQTQDVVDSGVADVDSAVAIPPFMTEVATAICTKLASCCATEVDASSFDSAACIANVTPVGYAGTALGAAPLLEAGVLTYNPAKAAACLNDINAIDCSGNVITTQQQIAILADCTAAVEGTAGAGSTCTQSIECAPGLFCNTPQDGGILTGPGQCAALRGDGGACGNFGDIPTPSCGTAPGLTCDFGLSEEACSYRRTGTSGLRCNNADPSTGITLEPPSGWMCEPAAATPGPCNLNQDCVSMLCDPGPPGYAYYGPDGGLVSAGGTTYACANSLPFAYSNSCLAYVH